MSFDWLNIPGLASGDTDVNTDQPGNLPPPTVSFDFGPSSTNPNDRTANISTSKRAGKHPKTQDSEQPKKDTQTLYVQPTSEHQYFDQPQRHDGARRTAFSNNNAQEVGSTSREQTKTNTQNQENIQVLAKYQETPEDLNVPLSLSRSQLTKEEARTYLRWYNCIILRTHNKLVRLSDVFRFLSNFNIDGELRERITIIFRTCKNALNIGQFFAVLRLISKALLQNVTPSRKMILDKAPVPMPRPILNSEHGSEVYEEVEEDDEHSVHNNKEHKVDFDSFASLLLTGKSTRKKIRRKIRNKICKNKRVRFSEHLTFQDAPSHDEQQEQRQDGMDGEYDDDDLQGNLDFSLPMDQLLKRIAKRKNHNPALVLSLPDEKQETEEEKEVLEEMKDSLSHFKQIQTGDLATTQLPSIKVDSGETNGSNIQDHALQLPLQPLKPTSTGSANYLFRQQYNTGPPPDVLEVNQQHYTSQYQNQHALQPLKPTATGSANYLVRNHFAPEQQLNPTNMEGPSPSPPTNGLQPLRPTATGSGNHYVKRQPDAQFNGQMNVLQNPNLPSPAQSPDVRISPQPTDQMSMGAGLLAPQPRIPAQQQISPQVTPQTQQNGLFNNQRPNASMLSAPNPASNYFQSLLSHSPSPNSSNSNLPNMNVDPNAYSYPQGQQIPMSQSRASYNNGYQYYSPMRSQQPYINQPAPQLSQHAQQSQQPQQPGNQNYTQNVNMSTNQGGLYANRVPMGPSPRGDDILGDLQSLKQQVDALQDVYGGR